MALKTTAVGRAQHALDFEGACNEMSAQIAVLYPGAAIEHKNKRRWRMSAAQHGTGRGRGHYGNQGIPCSGHSEHTILWKHGCS